MRDDTPYESARRAWSLLTALLHDLASYLENPTASDDPGRSWSSLAAKIDEVRERLAEAEQLLALGPATDPPPPALIAILVEAEAAATQVQVVTSVKYTARNPESDLYRIRPLIRAARGD